MLSKDKYYEAFGDLLYAMALADGGIQEVEEITMRERLQHYPESQKIIDRFFRNKEENNTVAFSYMKAIEVCKVHGPDPEYAFLLELLVAVARAYMGIVPEERKILDTFIRDLKNAFKADEQSC